MELRRLSSAHSSHIQWLEEVVLATPAYSWLTEGKAPNPADALEILRACPPGIGEHDKFVLAIQEEEVLLGCVDLVRGYPDKQTAYLGLLLLKECWQRRGVGSELVARLMGMAAGWGCTTLRLGVIETNAPALHFWSKHGFKQVDRKQIAGFTGDTLVMTRTVSHPYRPESSNSATAR
ncbi:MULTISPECIES: N-acetyltransferase [Aeromonas]|nr:MULTISPECIES: GNAT family N-acetyltransferase [Aeromonas]MCY9836325.1 GNAT family N-acetyltransferase [Aeromonas media]QJT26400.1 GNAT family N-acetyltransferase [Aeromonas media]WED80813.1 GNAT family N-acetyltransferase [Aeromonas media]WOQ12767.1 GNAT family N-acetyltransferase [Aeromonas media]